MVSLKIVFVTAILLSVHADQSVINVIQNMYKSCLQNFSVTCVKPTVLEWVNEVSDKSIVKITDDLILVKKYDPNAEKYKDQQKDVIEKFEDFLQTHDLVAKAPAIIRSDDVLGNYISRNYQPTDISVPLAATGRSSKLIKKVIFPFLLGLKFKTAVLVPLALALIALKTWKALTLGLLSLVLTGAIAIFSKFGGPKVPAYEVVHYPHHIDYNHVDVVQPALQYGYPVYSGRHLSGQDMAYASSLN